MTIIQEVLAGKVQAYAILVERYENLVFTLALRMMKNREEAEEVAQDVFVKTYQALAKFKGESKFSTWLYRITYNKCLDALARQKRQPAYENVEELSYLNLDGVETILDQMEATERERHIKKCIGQLPEDEAFLITLYYYEEQSIKEMVEVTNLSESNIKVKLYRARKRLFSMLDRSFFASNKQAL